MTTLRIRTLPHAEGLPLPAYAKPGDAGMDLRAAFLTDAPCKHVGPGGNLYQHPCWDPDDTGLMVWLEPGDRLLVPTGLQVAIPEGFEGQVRPRSGLALKRGLTVANAPGTVDAGYRGEVMVAIVNLNNQAEAIRRGDRIAQLVIAPVARCEVEQVQSLDGAERDAGGFGSTGVA